LTYRGKASITKSPPEKAVFCTPPYLFGKKEGSRLYYRGGDRKITVLGRRKGEKSPKNGKKRSIIDQLWGKREALPSWRVLSRVKK